MGVKLNARSTTAQALHRCPPLARRSFRGRSLDSHPRALASKLTCWVGPVGPSGRGGKSLEGLWGERCTEPCHAAHPMPTPKNESQPIAAQLVPPLWNMVPQYSYSGVVLLGASVFRDSTSNRARQPALWRKGYRRLPCTGDHHMVRLSSWCSCAPVHVPQHVCVLGACAAYSVVD